MTTIHRGRVFHIADAPVLADVVDHLVYHLDGALVVSDDGIISWCGAWADLPPEFANDPVDDHSGCFLLPGFVDTHMHFPQVNCGDSYGGGQLLEWLTNCIFPSEARFADPEFARGAAREWCDRMITAGTTTGLIFGSQFPVAQDLLFQTARDRGLRIIAGRTIMTVGPDAAAPLLTSEADAIELTRQEIEKWHPLDASVRERALQQVAIVPRFSLSVTPETLGALGVNAVLELAPGGVLTGLAKRSLKGVELLAIKSPDDLDAARDLVARHSATPATSPEETTA